MRTAAGNLTIFRMGFQNLVHVTRGVEGRNDINAVLFRFRKNFTDFGFGQILIRHDRRIGFALDAESEVFGEMHLERVHFVPGHFVDQSNEPVLGNVFAGAVDMNAPFVHRRIVHDRSIRNAALQQKRFNRVQAMQYGFLTCPGEMNAGCADFDAVRFRTA